MSLFFLTPGYAQELPPIFDQVPPQLLPATSLARLPQNTFLESIVATPEGDLFITNHEAGKILRLNSQGSLSIWATLAGKATGLVRTEDQSLLVTGVDPTQTQMVLRVDSTGQVTTLLKMPEAQFLNGITHLAGSRYLMADSYRGAIWLFDASQATAEIWLEHPLLARPDSNNPIPAVNGLKIFNNILYASNTAQQRLLKIPVGSDGKAGDPQIFVERINLDDFALDSDGNLYGATHIYNSVIKVTPQGSITIVGQPTVGSTAVAFGETPADSQSLYVVTNGGMFLPPPTGVEEAQVIRLQLDP
ncbi:MAG: SMP-30/gluconolactonase/LRE family protein [Cyanobacteriota bacterium]|nr:SMP-30/gluconolactonase/LRE family protein [Cyanobacteriota bacterium]